MKINYINQESSIPSDGLHYFLCASGFETRCTYFYTSNREVLDKCIKICFSFVKRVTPKKLEHDKLFRSALFEFVEVDDRKFDDYLVEYHRIFSATELKSVKMVVDFSSMTTILYAALLKYLYSLNDNLIDVSVYFVYTTAKFVVPQHKGALAHNYPIAIYDTLQTTDKNIALIIGLGFDEDKALGLCEYFDSDLKDVYLFATSTYSSPQYNKAVRKNNEILFQRVSEDNIIYYDLDNVPHLLSSLDSLISYLINSNTRVVLAPIGPKQFTLIALILNLFHSEVTAYRFSHGDRIKPTDMIPDTTKNSIITHVKFKLVS